MKITPDAGSPWGRKVRFDEREFDDIMDEVRSRGGGSAFVPGAGVDVDAVLRDAFEVEPDFVDLPNGVLGRTKFHPDGRVEVEVSRSLADAAEHDRVERRRLRSTLAHECGHGALHAHLHLADDQTLSLFGDQAPTLEPRVLCRHDTVGAKVRYDGQWWEYQANRGMSALLLPRRILAAQVKEVCDAKSVKNPEAAFVAEKGRLVLDALADIFDVNPRVVLYRLQELGYLPSSLDQEVLKLSE